MAQHSNGPLRVSSTDILIAMLSGDLRGCRGQAAEPHRRRGHGAPAASAALPAPGELEPPGEPEDPAR